MRPWERADTRTEDGAPACRHTWERAVRVYDSACRLEVFVVKLARRKRKQGLAGSRHDRERDGSSMSPEIRRLAISWGGPNELAPRLRIEDHVTRVENAA